MKRGDDIDPVLPEAKPPARRKWTPNGKTHKKPGRKKKRIILSTSFTIEQIKDFLELIDELNKGGIPDEILERGTVWAVIRKFENMYEKHKVAKRYRGKRPPGTRAHPWRTKPKKS